MDYDDYRYDSDCWADQEDLDQAGAYYQRELEEEQRLDALERARDINKELGL